MSTTVSKLHENLMHKIIKSVWFQSSFNLWLNVSLLNFLLPIHTALVFVEFNFKPEAIANLLKMLSASFNEFSVPSKSTVVSSANCERRYSVPSIFIPLISLLALNRRESISAHKRNMYGERGSPCLHPLLTVKGSERKPF